MMKCLLKIFRNFIDDGEDQNYEFIKALNEQVEFQLNL